MAMRSVSVSCTSSIVKRALMTEKSVGPRAMACFYSSDGKGTRVLSEEERAKETVYIQKMERERLEKQKLKAEKEKALKDKESSADKKTEGN